MIAPPGMPNITSTPSRTSASHMICAPVRCAGSRVGLWLHAVMSSACGRLYRSRGECVIASIAAAVDSLGALTPPRAAGDSSTAPVLALVTSAA